MPTGKIWLNNILGVGLVSLKVCAVFAAIFELDSKKNKSVLTPIPPAFREAAPPSGHFGYMTIYSVINDSQGKMYNLFWKLFVRTLEIMFSLNKHFLGS